MHAKFDPSTGPGKAEQATGVRSPQSWSQHLGLDYDQEQKNFAEHTKR